MTLPVRAYGAGDGAVLLAAFEDSYRRLYSRTIPGVEVEILSWVMVVSAPAPAFAHAAEPERAPAEPERAHAPKPKSRRSIYDPAAGEAIEVAIHWRADLEPGARIAGPAIIAEDETSTVVSRLFDARIDGFGYIHLMRRDA